MMSEVTNPILVRQIRGPRQETCHRAAFAITRGDDLLMSAGDVATPVFLRSGAKFFQAIPCVTSGAPERFHIGDRALDRLRQNGGQQVGFTWESKRAAA